MTWWPTSGDSSHGGASGEDKWEVMEQTWVGSGIIQGVGNHFLVYADSTGMHVKLQSGRAWLDGTMANEDAAGGDIQLSIAAADTTNPRIDRIIIRRDFTNHTMTYQVLTGTAAVAPVAPSISKVAQGLYDLSLAQIRVNPGNVTIAAGAVTDERYNPTVCGFAAQQNVTLLCLSTAHPTAWAGGGLIYEVDTGRLMLNVGAPTAPSFVALQVGAVSPESFFAGSQITIGTNYAVSGNVMFVFCMAGVQVILPAPPTTNRPITIMAVAGNTSVISAGGWGIAGGSIDPNSGGVLNGTINQGDALTFKAHQPDGVNWIWRAIY